jgi:hypothetical protein
MAVLPSGTYGQVNYILGGTGMPTGAQLTHGFLVAIAGDMAEAVTQLGLAFNTNMLPQLPTTVTWEQMLVKFGPNDTGPASLTAGGGAGTGNSGQVQPNMAILIRKNTSLGGRRGRGRLYWPCAEGEVDGGGAVLGAKITDLQDAVDSWLSDLTASGWTMQLLHDANPPLPSTVTSLAVQATAATQRRRLRR